MSDLPGPPLRIAVLGDFDGPHTRRWLREFVARGHDIHAISYYPPRAELPGVTIHVLSGARRDEALAPSARAPAATPVLTKAPASLLRLLHAWRYQRARLKQALAAIAPDVFHAHYVVEHGFYGAFAGFHPYVVSAWGSDLYVESYKPLGRLIAGWTLRRADLLTANDAALAARAIALGVPEYQSAVIHLGTDRRFLEAGERSVNLTGAASPPTVISDRALEPLYNVDRVLRAFARLRERLPDARLLVAHEGSQRGRLEALARRLGLGESVRFSGRLDPPALADALTGAHVYVSVPDSDSLALSNLEAMAAGAFPVLSDLPSLNGWVEHGVNGLRVPVLSSVEGEPASVDILTDALHEALTNAQLRKDAAKRNRLKVAAEGLTETNMLQMERHYYRLAGHPISETAI